MHTHAPTKPVIKDENCCTTHWYKNWKVHALISTLGSIHGCGILTLVISKYMFKITRNNGQTPYPPRTKGSVFTSNSVPCQQVRSVFLPGTPLVLRTFGLKGGGEGQDIPSSLWEVTVNVNLGNTRHSQSLVSQARDNSDEHYNMVSGGWGQILSSFSSPLESNRLRNAETNVPDTAIMWRNT